jgi:hypothetical protein
MFGKGNDIEVGVILNPRYEDEGSPSLGEETLPFVRVTAVSIHVIGSF